MVKQKNLAKASHACYDAPGPAATFPSLDA